MKTLSWVQCSFPFYFKVLFFYGDLIDALSVISHYLVIIYSSSRVIG